MSKPEIARRCQACGASIREEAAFCPQCGVELASPDFEGNPTTSVITAPLVDLKPGQDEASEKGLRPEFDGGKSEPGKNAHEPPIKPAPAVSGKPGGKVRNQIQRATNRARDVEGDVKQRVQKVRQISSVVLDEAGYDPSLRFVLVAAALFLLFLLVLLLNKVIG